LITENRVLKETHGSKRIVLSDDQRRRLAVKGKVLGRKRLEEIGTLFTPDTILRWHRLLVAQKWDYSARRKKPIGRPLVTKEWPSPEPARVSSSARCREQRPITWPRSLRNWSAPRGSALETDQMAHQHAIKHRGCCF
jgi:hypothetical protein